jgi:succinate dehydrogenase / fumarate reductase flavoprotein subunit
MGGLWVDYEKDPQTGGLKYASPRNHATNIPGLYACGECDYAYHGANRLGANSLLSASFSGRVAGESVVAYLRGLESHHSGITDEQAIKREQAKNDRLMQSHGEENPYRLHAELGALMSTHVGVVRDNSALDLAYEQLQTLAERAERVALGDVSNWSNHALAYARQVQEMVRLGTVIAKSARARDECRGAHYKPAYDIAIPEGKFPGDPEFEAYLQKWKRNNQEWLKTSLAEYRDGEPAISYEPVDTSVVPPEHPRDYR